MSEHLPTFKEYYQLHESASRLPDAKAGWRGTTIHGQPYEVVHPRGRHSMDAPGLEAKYLYDVDGNPMSGTIDDDLTIVRLDNGQTLALKDEDNDDTVAFTKPGSSGGGTDSAGNPMTPGPGKEWRGLGKAPDPNTPGDKGSLLHRATTTASKAGHHALTKIGQSTRSKDQYTGKLFGWAADKVFKKDKKPKPGEPTAATAAPGGGTATT